MSDMDIELPCDRPAASLTRLSKYDMVKKFEMLCLFVVTLAEVGKISITLPVVESMLLMVNKGWLTWWSWYGDHETYRLYNSPLGLRRFGTSRHSLRGLAHR